ncbi:putative calcium-binding protein CML41 [Sesamum alatum]|uniref:Calcium-binding protein CML41 n=1 Tax=Sesamum alatum TaxID=300844 RepID=A0AAE1YQV5_9LAMI|nr:putative calcium-binding protein CML41 [Sesamum alatum]
MAISSIAKPVNTRSFKLRLPRRLRFKPSAAGPSPETTSPGCGSPGGGLLTPKTSTSEDEFRQVFSFLDADSDGKISAEELGDYFASVDDSLTYEDAKRIIREFSNSRDEESLLLEFADFVRLMELRDSDGDVVLRQAFEVYEVDKGSGYITPAGLRQVLHRLGDVKSLQECKAMIRVYDLDGNGVLDFHEFSKMMTLT